MDFASANGRKAIATFLSFTLTFGTTVLLYLYLSTLPREWLPQPIAYTVVDGGVPGNNYSNRNHVTGSRSTVHQILFFNSPAWLSERSHAVDFRQCPVGNCLVHEDRRKLNKSKAVVFSISDGNLGSVPPLSGPGDIGKRDPDQAWIMFSLESSYYIRAFHQEFKRPGWKNVFNWTMTPRRDSDIFLPYGILERRKQPLQKDYSKIFREKTKFAAWLVSHCDTQSKRMNYVKMLQKYIPVDIYGGCGKRRKNDSMDSYKDFFNKDYKFYFGFENSLCRDYITEKYYRYSQLDLIVVARGGSDYNDILPKHTYINTDDFSSVKTLADFLKQLAANEADYISYLRAKDEYVLPPTFTNYQAAYCKLCERLNTIDQHRKTIGNVVKWVEDGQCRNPSDLKDT